MDAAGMEDQGVPCGRRAGALAAAGGSRYRGGQQERLVSSKRQDERRVVYSTDRNVPKHGERSEEANVYRHGIDLPDLARPRVQREKAGRAGKWVTVVYDLPLPDGDLERLCSRIKRLCASGGTVKRGTIEIQGDHATRVLEALAAEGIKARRSGA